MDQYSYETILACIQTGAPAIASQLTAAFNNVINLANERIQQKQIEQQVAEEKRAAAAAKKKK